MQGGNRKAIFNGMRIASWVLVVQESVLTNLHTRLVLPTIVTAFGVCKVCMSVAYLCSQCRYHVVVLVASHCRSTLLAVYCHTSPSALHVLDSLVRITFADFGFAL